MPPPLSFGESPVQYESERKRGEQVDCPRGSEFRPWILGEELPECGNVVIENGLFELLCEVAVTLSLLMAVGGRNTGAACRDGIDGM